MINVYQHSIRISKFKIFRFQKKTLRLVVFSTQTSKIIVYAFSCGLGLRHFELTDDIWLEHALHSSNCLIVKLNSDIIKERSSLINFDSNCAIKEWFNSRIAKDLKANGYKTSKIKKIFYKKYQSDRENYDSLTNAMSDLSVKETFDKDKDDCIICFSNNRNILFLGCAHLIVCSFCAVCFTHCPLCKQYIKGVVRVFNS